MYFVISAPASIVVEAEVPEKKIDIRQENWPS